MRVVQILAQATQSATQAAPGIATYIAHACIAGAVAIILLVMFTFYRRARAGKAPTADMPEPPLSTGTVQEAERLFKLMGEAEEQAARLSAELSDRTARLERLIQAADQRLAALQAPPAPSPRPATPAPVPQPQPPMRVVTRPIEFALSPAHAPQPAPSPDARLAADARALRDQLMAIEARLEAASAEAQSAVDVPARQTMTPARAVQVEGSSESLANAIYRFSDQGLTPPQIAQHLGQQTGTIELFLALRQS